MKVFQQAMVEATRLTRAGRLVDATAAIQRVLAGHRKTPSEPIGPTVQQGATLDGEFHVVSEAHADLRQPGLDSPPVLGEVGVPHRSQFLAGTHRHAGDTRTYKLFVPSGYIGQPMPLIVMLHGCKQDADDFSVGTRMNHLGEERGFLVLYPQQSKQANPSRCWNWFEPRHQRRDLGEPALLADLTRFVANAYRVDMRRVYVAGLSAGGAMAVIMGRTYPDLFAAIGVHSGLPYGVAHDVPSAFEAMKRGHLSNRLSPESSVESAGEIPAILFHGDRDRTVHPRNSAAIATARRPSARQTSARQTSSTGAASQDARVNVESGQVPGGRAYTRTLELDVAGDVITERWVIHGAGHAWSGGDARGSFTDPRGPDAALAMVRFFEGHPLQHANSTFDGNDSAFNQ